MNCVTSLYSHQQAAVDKLLPTRVGGLFMEMGTGKTRTAIELVARRRQRISRVLWFCPVSLKATIRAEILRHTDCASDDVYVFDDKTTKRNTPRAFWYIIGLESISGSDRATLAAYSLINRSACVIVDESSYIKTHNAKRTQRLTYMARDARYRLILTGTPLTQGVVDLYAQMNFLSEKILGYRSFYAFARNHLEYSETYPGLIVRTHNVPRLASKIQPYVYQVTKEECLDLPGKIYERRYFDLSDAQNEAYAQAKWEILYGDDAAEELTSYLIFRLFTALQQIVCGYWRRRTEDGELEQVEFADNRTPLLMSVLHDIPAHEPVIIWAKYHHSIRQIVAALGEAYGAEQVAQFHGGLSEQAREAELDRWRTGARFLVATQAAGGHGLNLTEAAYVIFHSNEFKYSTRLQAEDRCHRIGTTRKVTYIDLVASHSIDERILQALHDKADVVDAFRRQVEGVKDLTRTQARKMIEQL